MRRIVGLLGLLLVSGTACFAQLNGSHAINLSITAAALIELAGGGDTDFTLSLSGLPADAGLAPAGGPFTATRYLQYTVLSGGTAAKIQASLDSDLPTGLALELTATAGTGGAGTQGAGQAIAAVDDTDRDLVTGIGGCYTGQGATDGAAVDYELTTSSYIGGSITRTITYTLSGW